MSAVQGTSGEMPLLPLEVPLSSYAVIFYKGSAARSGGGGFKAAIATSGFREDEVYGMLKDGSILLACFAAACCGRSGVGEVAQRLSHSFGALFEGIGYV